MSKFAYNPHVVKYKIHDIGGHGEDPELTVARKGEEHHFTIEGSSHKNIQKRMRKNADSAWVGKDNPNGTIDIKEHRHASNEDIDRAIDSGQSVYDSTDIGFSKDRQELKKPIKR